MTQGIDGYGVRAVDDVRGDDTTADAQLEQLRARERALRSEYLRDPWNMDVQRAHVRVVQELRHLEESAARLADSRDSIVVVDSSPPLATSLHRAGLAAPTPANAQSPTLANAQSPTPANAPPPIRVADLHTSRSVPFTPSPLGVVPTDTTTPVAAMTRMQILDNIRGLTPLVVGPRVPDRAITARLYELHRRLAYLDMTPKERFRVDEREESMRLRAELEANGDRTCRGDEPILQLRQRHAAMLRRLEAQGSPRPPVADQEKFGIPLVEYERRMAMWLDIVRANDPLSSLAFIRSWMLGQTLDEAHKSVAAASAAWGLIGSLAMTRGQATPHFDTTRKPDVVTMQPKAARPAAPRGVPDTPAVRVPARSGVDVHAPPPQAVPAPVARFANAPSLARYVGRPLDPNALPPGYTTYRMGDGTVGIRRMPGNAQESHAPLHVDEKGIVRFGERRAADTRVIPRGTSLTAAHAFMTGDEVPSLQAYSRMLVANGIATEAEIVATLSRNGFEGRRVSDVRHALKEAFRSRVMDRMLVRGDAAEAAARARYGDLPWTTRPEAARAEARQREMVRLTTGLNSSDIGTLAEEWYCEVTGLKGAATHVRVDAGALGKQGIVLAKVRQLDVVHGETVHEIKRVSGELDGRDKEQFVDLMKVANAARPVDIGGGRIVREVRYTFVDPRGAKANEGWMKDALAKNKNLSFEIFNARGESLVVSQRHVDRDPNVITNWLSR